MTKMAATPIYGKNKSTLKIVSRTNRPLTLGFHSIFFMLVGYQDIHKSMDEFEIWSDPITDYGVSCP